MKTANAFRSGPSIATGLSCAVLLALVAGTAQAATRTWTNSLGGAWTAAGRWDGTAPGSADIAKFTNAPSTAITNGAALSIGAVWLTTGSGNITISNSATTTFYGLQTINSLANVGLYLDNNLNKTLTLFSSGYTLQNSQTFYIGAGNTATITENAASGSLNLNGKTLTIDGAGFLQLNRVNNAVTQTTGTIIKNGSGTTANTGSFLGRIDQLQLNGGAWGFTLNWGLSKFNNTDGILFTGNATLNYGSLVNSSEPDLSSKIKINDGVIATFNVTAGTMTNATAYQLGPNKTGGIAKDGGNTLLLSAVNIYTGATTINAGTLKLSSTGSIGSSTTIDVKSGAFFDVSAVASFTLGSGQTLKGNGTVLGTIAANGTITPGNSIGTLTAGNLTLAGYTVMEIDRDAAQKSDLLSASAITYGGTLTVTNIGTGTLQAGDTFNLFDWTTGPGVSTFALLNLPDVSGLGLQWSTVNLSSVGEISLVVVPEPSVLVLVGLGFSGLVLLRRRRK